MEDMMKAKAIVLTISLVFVSVALGYQDDASMGTWKLNEAKSKFAPGALKNHTVIYEAAGENVKVIVDGVGGDADLLRELSRAIEKWPGRPAA